MKLLRLKPDTQHYKELALDCVQLYEQLNLGSTETGLIDCSELGRTGRPFPYLWQDVEAHFEASPMYPDAIQIPSISIWIGSAMLLSERAYAALRLILKNEGEFLPINIFDTTYYIFNLFTFGKVDEERTLYQYDSDNREFPDGIIKLVFEEQDVQDKFIFRSDEKSFGGVFCTEDFKHTCEEFDLAGLIFDENLSNIY